MDRLSLEEQTSGGSRCFWNLVDFLEERGQQQVAHITEYTAYTEWNIDRWVSIVWGSFEDLFVCTVRNKKHTILFITWPACIQYFILTGGCSTFIEACNPWADLKVTVKWKITWSKSLVSPISHTFGHNNYVQMCVNMLWYFYYQTFPVQLQWARVLPKKSEGNSWQINQLSFLWSSLL